MAFPIPEGKHKIAKIYWGMRLFDNSGCFIGRAYFKDPGEVCVLYPDGSTREVPKKEMEHNIAWNFWTCQPDDPAIIGQWETEKDVPDPPPGQSFQDGFKVGFEQAKESARTWVHPPDWIFEGLQPSQLTGNDFNDGWTDGHSSTIYQLLKRKFKDHQPPKQDAPSWENRRWGIDPQDPNQVRDFQAGYELARRQDEWLPKLNADQYCDKQIEQRAQQGEPVTRIMAFRFGFYSGMEDQFAKRY